MRNNVERNFVTVLKSSSPFSSQPLQEQVEVRVSKVENKWEKMLKDMVLLFWDTVTCTVVPGIVWNIRKWSPFEMEYFNCWPAASLDTLNAFLHTPGYVCRATIAITAEGNLEIESYW